MLRTMLGKGRRTVAGTSSTSSKTNSEDRASEDSEEDSERQDEEVLEPWYEWVQRVTGIALEEMKKAGDADWADAVRQQIWRLAGHIARRHDGRWSEAVLDWRPEAGKRNVGHPLKRWEDAVAQVFQRRGVKERGAWRLVAACREEWAKHEQEVVARGLESES